MQQGAYLIRDKILRRLALSYPPLALEAAFCFDCHILPTQKVQWACGPNSKCATFFSMHLEYKDPEVNPLLCLHQDKGDETVYTRKSLNINLTVFRERKTGMLSFGALPTLKLEHGDTTGTSLSDLKHQLSHTPAVWHETSREKRLVEVSNWCVNTEQLSYRPSFRSKHAHAAGFHSFFGLNISADAPFWDSGKYLHFYDAASVLCVNGRVTASVWSSPTTAG